MALYWVASSAYLSVALSSKVTSMVPYWVTSSAYMSVALSSKVTSMILQCLALLMALSYV